MTGQHIDLARKRISKKHVLCPGLLGCYGKKNWEKMGYIPKNVSVHCGKYVRSVSSVRMCGI